MTNHKGDNLEQRLGGGVSREQILNAGLVPHGKHMGYFVFRTDWGVGEEDLYYFKKTSPNSPYLLKKVIPHDVVALEIGEEYCNDNLFSPLDRTPN
ncbi:hypothetical protein KY347_06365 [Candidatus Woesearchaeota archaeon]|nr:hypothetical protein [Candidatus Woesearchaeota archaeon]